ncbi:MAG: FliH/SctL family protein [Anaerolineales bacterium]|nr:FliH/SctL family protein [Anaerolineales bacterium]
MDFHVSPPVNRVSPTPNGPSGSGNSDGFVELVEIVKEKITSSPTATSVNTEVPTGEVKLWQPEALVAIQVKHGNTHDHLRSRELTQKAEETLRKAQREAEQLLAEARLEAQRIVQEAEDQASLIHRQAYADGQAAANAEAQSMLKAARAIVDEVQKWKENLFEQGEMMMLRLVIEIAQTIFGDGLPLDPDTLGQAFARALSQAKSLGDLRVYLHPEDAAMLSAHWDKLQGVTAGQRVELIPSDLIKRGGCYIEGQYGTVDARVETQFQLATDALLSALEKNQAG